MGSVKNSSSKDNNTNKDLKVVASNHKKKHSVKDPVQKNIVAMFDEEADAKPKKKVHKTKMV
jgi:hypothetical protein